MTNPSFSLGPIAIQYYGLILGIAFLAGYFLAAKRRHFYKVEKKDFEGILFISGILGILGARIYHVITELDYYLAFPLQVFNFKLGGLGIFGVILGGTLGVFIFSWRNKQNPWKFLDLAAPSLALGQAIGRWGNFINQELVGLPSQAFWSIFVEQEKRPTGFLNYEFFHPLFLYESVLSFLIFLILIKFSRRFLKKSGALFALYLIFYSFVRFNLEFLRAEKKMAGFLSINQETGIFFLVCGIILFKLKSKEVKMANLFLNLKEKIKEIKFSPPKFKKFEKKKIKAVDVQDKETEEVVYRFSIPVSYLTPLAILISALLIAWAIKSSGGFGGTVKSTETQKGSEEIVVSPTPQLADVKVDDDDVLGPKDAKVTVIVFSDFQCPYCAAAEGYNDAVVQYLKSLDPSWEAPGPKLKELAREGKIKYVFRDFALSSHAYSQKAAEAAECAGEQGKFWEMQEKLFEKQTEWSNAEDSIVNFKTYAKELGLETQSFANCLDSGQMAAEVEKDFSDGQAAGVKGTPAFFVNSQQVAGAKSFSYFEALIEEILGR